MPYSIVMPALGMAQETGKVVAWRKQEGEPIAKGEPMLEVETDKTIVELEAPADGVLAGITALAGAEVPVGRTIAWILAPGETIPAEK
jgi:pyruvate dehydrogenase E2 component (dihydrolipoamide acetyltransferase)